MSIESYTPDVFDDYTSRRCVAFLEGYCAAKGITTKQLADDIDHFEVALHCYDEWKKSESERSYFLDHLNFDKDKIMMKCRRNNFDFTKSICIRMHDPANEFRSTAIGLNENGVIILAEAYGDLTELLIKYGERRKQLRTITQEA
jgi:hypothetical protein